MYKIVYFKEDGAILAQTNIENIELLYENYGEEFISTLGVLELKSRNDLLPSDSINYYKILNGKIVERPNSEIEEIRKYGKVLTEEEREQLNQPKPPSETEMLKEQVKELQEVIDILIGGEANGL